MYFFLDNPYLMGYLFAMSVYKSIMQGLTEAVDYQQGKINARKTRLTFSKTKLYLKHKLVVVRSNNKGG